MGCACCFMCRSYSCMDCLFSFSARPYVLICNFHSCNDVRMSHWIKGYLTWDGRSATLNTALGRGPHINALTLYRVSTSIIGIGLFTDGGTALSLIEIRRGSSNANMEFSWTSRLERLRVCTAMVVSSSVTSLPIIRHHTTWIGLSSVLRLRQHSIGYMGDGFYRSKDPTNSIKVLKEHTVHR